MQTPTENPYQSPPEPETAAAAPAERLSKSERVLFGIVLALIAVMCLVLANRIPHSLAM